LLYYKVSYFGLFIGAFSWAFLIVLGLSFIFSRKILKPFYLVYLILLLYSGMMMQGLDAYMADIVKFAFAAIFMYCILLVFSIFFKNNKEFE
jgi:hypothetical protein